MKDQSYETHDKENILTKHKGRMIKLFSGEHEPTSKNERGFLEYAQSGGQLRPPKNIFEAAWELYMLKNDSNYGFPLKKGTGICSRCGGDGGVNGGCNKCDGRGWSCK